MSTPSGVWVMNVSSNHIHAGKREFQHMLSSSPYPRVRVAPRPYPSPAEG
ncbi:hypothetical protein ACNOYE_24680 [Nannocystaceae bacterium ST9]